MTNQIAALKVWRANAEKLAGNRTLAEQEETIRKQGNHGTIPMLRGGLLTALGAPTPKDQAELCLIFGCYRPFTTPILVRDILRLLKLLQIDYTYLADEYCCGAPLVMQADESTLPSIQASGNEFVRLNVESAKERGAGRLAYCCAGCVHAAQNAYPDGSDQHVYINDLIMRHLENRPLSLAPSRMGYFPGCHTFFRNVYPAAQFDWQDIRNRLDAIEGLNIVDLPEKTCCKVSAARIIDNAEKHDLEKIICPCNWCYTSLQQVARGRVELVSLPELILQCISE
jgi:Fe-S oxidoreductase